MHDDRPTTSTSWIDSYDRRTGELIARHEATDDEVRNLAADRAVPAATPGDGPERAPAGRTDDDGLTTCTTSNDDGPPPPRFRHDPAAGVFRLTAPDGSVEAFHDEPAKYICVEPDPETGAIRPVTRLGRPVYLYLCREEVQRRKF